MAKTRRNKTKHRKHRKTRGGKIAGRGASGCVYRPAMRCKGNNSTTTNTVSKYMRAYTAEEEFQTQHMLSQIDPDNHYFIYPTRLCDVANNYTNAELVENPIRNCRVHSNNASNMRLLQIPDGGDTLQAWINRYSYSMDPVHTLNMLESFDNLMRGVGLLHANDMMHMDIKSINVVGKQIDDAIHLRLIDFGLALNPLHFSELPSYSIEHYEADYFIWPFETRYLADIHSPLTTHTFQGFLDTLRKECEYTYYKFMLKRSDVVTMQHRTNPDGTKTSEYIYDVNNPNFIFRKNAEFLAGLSHIDRIRYIATKTDVYSLGRLLLKMYSELTHHVFDSVTKSLKYMYGDGELHTFEEMREELLEDDELYESILRLRDILTKRIHMLCFHMTNVNVQKRFTMSEALRDWETILKLVKQLLGKS